MEGLGAEVSAKIRSAIKAKLIELEAYVDDELPDYIMVMVANNRNKEQMEEDLGLFLNNNCKAFTNWLHAVLEKLKKVTLDEVSKKDAKKKKSKKVVGTEKENSVKKPVREIKEKEKDRKSKSDNKKPSSTPSSSSTKPRVEKTRGDKSKSSNNANLEDLGKRKRKKPTSLDDSGGKDGYNPSSMLKSAVEKSEGKTSPRKSSKKSIRKERKLTEEEAKKSPKKSIKKNIINLKEEVGFYKEEASGIEARRRSRSRERGRSGLQSLVSKVVRPEVVRQERRPRARSWSAGSDEWGGRRGVASRALVPPRPARPPGREERGVARAVSRAMHDAAGRGRREVDDPRDRDIRWEQREEWEPQPGPPHLSPEDLRRYEFLKRRREDLQDRKMEEKEIRELNDYRQRSRDIRDREREERARLESKLGRGNKRPEREEELHRESSLDRKLMRKREERLRARAEEEDLRIVVKRDDTPEVTPPKKRKLEDDDAELLEMRRKALESLMKRTDSELVSKI